MGDHDAPESVIRIGRNGRSGWAGTTTYLRANLAVWLDGSVALDLTDAQGKVWANLAARSDGAALTLSYEQGRVGAGLTALSDGTVGLTLYDAPKKPQAGLLLDKDGKVLWKAP